MKDRFMEVSVVEGSGEDVLLSSPPARYKWTAS